MKGKKRIIIYFIALVIGVLIGLFISHLRRCHEQKVGRELFVKNVSIICDKNAAPVDRSLAQTDIAIYYLAGNEPPVDALPMLKENLFDENETVRKTVGIALMCMGPKAKESLPDLKTALEKEEIESVKTVFKDAIDVIEERKERPKRFTY